MDAKAPAPVQSVDNIIAQSVAANQRDWAADPEYSYSETDSNGRESKTWKVTMLFGSPYKQLVSIDRKPISEDQQNQEQAKFQKAVAQRKTESAAETQKRIAEYERGRRRDHVLMEQLAKAFDFNLRGMGTMSGHSVYVLNAMPKPGYQPPVTDARVLTGMRGTLWIDKATAQWVKVRAEVISPVSIEGFLARVEPGTWFELDKTPVANGVWLPEHFGMRSRAKVLFMFNHGSRESDDYFDYHKTPPEYLKKGQ